MEAIVSSAAADSARVEGLQRGANGDRSRARAEVRAGPTTMGTEIHDPKTWLGVFNRNGWLFNAGTLHLFVRARTYVPMLAPRE